MATKKHNKKNGRRRNGEGSVSERSDGYFQASLMSRGKRKFEYAQTKNEAYEKLEAMREKARRGVSLTGGDVTLNDFVSSYIERYAKPYVRPSTLKNYIGYADNYIKNSNIGKMKVSRIAADDVQDFVNYLAGRDLSGKTVSNIFSFVEAVFAQAVINRLIIYNPCEGVRLPKKKSKERPLIDKEEFDKLVSSANTQTMRTGISVLGEGLRIGELLGLKWNDCIKINDIPVLKVSKALKREYIFDERQEKEKETKTEIRLSETKTDSSERFVPLLPNVIEELKKLKEEQEATAGELGIKFSEDMFIIGEVDKKGFRYITPDKFRADFAKCVLRAGLPKEVTPHALRRYTSSTLIRHGASPVAVAKLLGHSSANTTLTYYSRESLKGAFEAMKLLTKEV